MKGNGVVSVMAENMTALAGAQEERRIYTKPKMCWRCQKDKPTAGGHIKTYAGGPMKFICKDCLVAKETK